jgi:hypothetical protein
MERPHARAWFSEFAGTTILLFASVLVTRWVFGPQSAWPAQCPGCLAAWPSSARPSAPLSAC